MKNIIAYMQVQQHKIASMIRTLGTFAFILMIGSAVYAQQRTITVAADGAGDFKSVQEAIAAVPERSTAPILIHIKPATYAGPFIIPRNKPHITLLGDDPTTTIAAIGPTNKGDADARVTFSSTRSVGA